MADDRRSNIILFLAFFAACIFLSFPFTDFVLLEQNKDNIPKAHSIYGSIMSTMFGLVLTLFVVLAILGLFFCIPSAISLLSETTSEIEVTQLSIQVE